MPGRRALSVGALLAAIAWMPAAAFAWAGQRMWMPGLLFHFWAVGVAALALSVAAAALGCVAWRRRDPRTALLGLGFSTMAALLAVHGLTTPGVLVGPNSVIAICGAATLPVGGAILALSAWPPLASAAGLRLLLWLQAVTTAGVLGLGALAIAVPTLLPAVPTAASPPAHSLLVAGLLVYALLGLRAAQTFLLTRRLADLVAVVGIVLLGAALYSALELDPMLLGWWMGHGFELLGITLVCASVLYDLTRGRQSRVLLGDLRAGEIVAAEEAYLGARVRALMVRLAEKDASTEEHTRRVASLAVALGEELGLPPSRLRSLAMGGLLHDIGKLATPAAILGKPGALSDAEYAVIKRHPEHGRVLLAQLGGFDPAVQRLVLDHHERLDGEGYPRGRCAAELDVPTRILSVCDVYDALTSPRVYRAAWSTERALHLLRDEAGSAFDPDCVAALERVLGAGVGELRRAA